MAYFILKFRSRWLIIYILLICNNFQIITLIHPCSFAYLLPGKTTFSSASFNPRSSGAGLMMLVNQKEARTCFHSVPTQECPQVEARSPTLNMMQVVQGNIQNTETSSSEQGEGVASQ